MREMKLVVIEALPFQPEGTLSNKFMTPGSDTIERSKEHKFGTIWLYPSGFPP